MAELRGWLDTPAARGVWVWHAAGGQGKTRLAGYAVAAAASAGWRVGVARHCEDTPGVGQALPAGGDRLLVLVDYAERWPLRDLYRLLADCTARAPVVRVLLLARSIDWWPAAAVECDKLGFAVDTTQPRPLAALATDVPARHELFTAACHRFAQIYELDDPPVFTAAGSLVDDPVYGVTLGLHMAALAAADAHVQGAAAPALSGDVSRYLLDRERCYWVRLHGEDNTDTAAQVVLLACLAGAQLPADGSALLQRTSGL